MSYSTAEWLNLIAVGAAHGRCERKAIDPQRVIPRKVLDPFRVDRLSAIRSGGDPPAIEFVGFADVPTY